MKQNPSDLAFIRCADAVYRDYPPLYKEQILRCFRHYRDISLVTEEPTGPLHKNRKVFRGQTLTFANGGQIKLRLPLPNVSLFDINDTSIDYKILSYPDDKSRPPYFPERVDVLFSNSVHITDADVWKDMYKLQDLSNDEYNRNSYTLWAQASSNDIREVTRAIINQDHLPFGFIVYELDEGRWVVVPGGNTRTIEKMVFDGSRYVVNETTGKTKREVIFDFSKLRMGEPVIFDYPPSIVRNRFYGWRRYHGLRWNVQIERANASGTKTSVTRRSEGALSTAIVGRPKRSYTLQDMAERDAVLGSATKGDFSKTLEKNVFGSDTAPHPAQPSTTTRLASQRQDEDIAKMIKASIVDYDDLLYGGAPYNEAEETPKRDIAPSGEIVHNETVHDETEATLEQERVKAEAWQEMMVKGIAGDPETLESLGITPEATEDVSRETSKRPNPESAEVVRQVMEAFRRSGDNDEDDYAYDDEDVSATTSERGDAETGK